MEGIQLVLETIRERGFANNRLPGVFHLALGRRVSAADGTILSIGVTWRQLATLLKNLKYDKSLIREVGADPDTLWPRDREKMWFSVIPLARVESTAARQMADEIAVMLAPLGFIVAPHGAGPDSPKKSS